MKVLAILWTVCLVRLCHCQGSRVPDDRPVIEVRDDYKEDKTVTSNLVGEGNTHKSTAWTGTRQTWDLSNGTVHGGDSNKAPTESKEETSPRTPTTSKPATPITKSAGQSVTTPPKDSQTLDLSNPDTSKLDVHMENESEVSFKGYTPKNAFHISSVMDGQVYVWEAGAGERCTLVESYIEGDSTLISIVINGSDYGLDLKYFEKVGGQWKGLNRDVFFNKFNEMREFPNPSSHPS